MCEREQEIILGYYPVMEEYRKNRAKAGLSKRGICVDRCMAGQIISLWEAGIRTYGCCCGHGEKVGFINLAPEDFAKAIELGWEEHEQHAHHDRKDTVFPKKPYPCDYDSGLNGQVVWQGLQQ